MNDEIEKLLNISMVEQIKNFRYIQYGKEIAVLEGRIMLMRLSRESMLFSTKSAIGSKGRFEITGTELEIVLLSGDTVIVKGKIETASAG
ncbi:MAG: hypothetical protein PHX51_01265 [Clostridia bacterium]|nr:hypothetical protein [Clostridia bacterium]